MKYPLEVKLDEEIILDLSIWQLTLLEDNVLTTDIFWNIKKRLKWIIQHKLDRGLLRLKNQWEARLKERFEQVPTGDKEFCELVFSQPDYKNKTQRYAESPGTT